jgi:hypothetical protein
MHSGTAVAAAATAAVILPLQVPHAVLLLLRNLGRTPSWQALCQLKSLLQSPHNSETPMR